MDEETVQKTIKFIKKRSKEFRKLSLNFYGGEPLLFPDILLRITEELKEFADKNNIEFYILTEETELLNH